MNEINQSYNLNSYYTSNTKIEKPKHVVATPPGQIPQYVLYTDQKANKRLSEINNDIFVEYEKTPKNKKKKFLGLF